MLAAPPHSLLDGASLFLDFDGTLVELADRPDRVVIGPDLRPLLLDLRDALEGRLAIVSGRSVATLRMAFGLSDFLLSGSHGLEHARPGQSAEAMDRPPAIDFVLEKLRVFASVRPGILRAEERRVGKECVSTCRSRGSQYHLNTTKQKTIN